MAIELELSSQQVLDLWFHYEEIAMHFNELIIQYRLQLLAGTGGLLAILSYLVNAKEGDVDKVRMRAYISLTVLVIFSAAAWLDIFYYSKLLSGAVESIIELESNYEQLNLSTTIKEKFGCMGATYQIMIMYLCIIAFMVFFTYRFWKEHLGRNNSKP